MSKKFWKEVFTSNDDSAHITITLLVGVTVNGISPVYAVDSRTDEFGYVVGEDERDAFIAVLVKAGYRV